MVVVIGASLAVLALMYAAVAVALYRWITEDVQTGEPRRLLVAAAVLAAAWPVVFSVATVQTIAGGLRERWHATRNSFEWHQYRRRGERLPRAVWRRRR